MLYREVEEKIKSHDASLEEITIDTENWANVKIFGAIGDGISDDTIAIQNAIKSKKKYIFPKRYL